jgi:hypothetical protein
LRGIAVAALHDAGDVEASEAAATKLLKSKQVSSMTWAALICAKDAGRLDGSGEDCTSDGGGASKSGPVLTESNHRRIQLGWVE